MQRRPIIYPTIAEVPGKIEHSRPKSPEKPSKASERFDPIGDEITALLAAAPVADSSYPQQSLEPLPRWRPPLDGGNRI
jgi:hypothetical protein